MVAGGHDAGVRLGESLQPDMIAVKIGPAITSVLVAAPAYFETMPKPVHPRDLAGHRCIRYRFASGVIYRWEFEKDGEEIELAVDGPLILGEDRLLVDAAISGAGLAFVFEDYAAAALADGRLVRVMEDWSPILRRFLPLLSRPASDAASAARLCRFLPHRRLACLEGDPAGMRKWTIFDTPAGRSTSSARPSSTSSGQITSSMQALVRARAIDLPDWLVVSGALYNAVWNRLTRKPCGFGTKDIDLFYFDEADTVLRSRGRRHRHGRSAFCRPAAAGRGEEPGAGASMVRATLRAPLPKARLKRRCVDAVRLANPRRRRPA